MLGHGAGCRIIYAEERPEWQMEKYRFYCELPGDIWEDGYFMQLIKMNQVTHGAAGCMHPDSATVRSLEQETPDPDLNPKPGADPALTRSLAHTFISTLLTKPHPGQRLT